MKRVIVLVYILCVAYTSHAQVRIVNSANNTGLNDSPAFIDASSNPTVNNSDNVGKGLIFPRVDLSAMTAFPSVTAGIPTSFPTRFDGMIVYNTATTGTAGVGSTQGTLSPGFWYYENKSSTNTGGTWKPLGSISAEVDGVIGNEVTNATASGGLVRAGSGTAAAPYTLGIADNGVTAARIAANAVTNAKIAEGAIDSAKIASNAIKTVHINANAVTSAKIADATIVAADIANTTITGAKLANATVTATQLADGAVTSAKILDGTIATADIAANAIDSTKIKDKGVGYGDLTTAGATSGQVLKYNGTAWMPGADANTNNTYKGSTSVRLVSDSLVRAALTGDITAAQNDNATTIAANAVTSAKIADGTIVAADIANTTITGAKLVNATVTATQLADNAVSTAKIADNAVTVAKLPAGATSSTYLRGDGTWVTPPDNNTTYTGSTSVTLTSGSFQRAALTGDVTAGENQNVTSIAPGSVTSEKLAAGSVGAMNLQRMGAEAGQTLVYDGQKWTPAQVNASSVATTMKFMYCSGSNCTVNPGSGWTCAVMNGGGYYTYENTLWSYSEYRPATGSTTCDVALANARCTFLCLK